MREEGRLNKKGRGREEGRMAGREKRGNGRETVGEQ